jgi:hypothetical protein
LLLCVAGGRAASLALVYLVVPILTTQRGGDRLIQRRDLLNLELRILSEQGIDEVVALLRNLGAVTRTAGTRSMN